MKCTYYIQFVCTSVYVYALSDCGTIIPQKEQNIKLSLIGVQSINSQLKPMNLIVLVIYNCDEIFFFIK